MQQNLIERILAKTVGVEMSSEELELVAGGRMSICDVSDAYVTRTVDAEVCDAY